MTVMVFRQAMIDHATAAKKALQINMFDGFALFSLGEKPQNGTDDQQSDSARSNGGQQTDGRTP